MENYKIVASSYFNNIDNNIINDIVIANSYNKDLVYNHHKWSKYLKNYLILTHKPSIINIEMDKLSLYLSRYYWFKKFYYSYSLENGTDVGIEQQIIKLLESIGNEFKEFDWYEIQKINFQIENE